MRRREFITRLGGAAVWPLAARAQQLALPVVAFISGGSADAQAARLAGFRKGLSEAGYAGAQNVTVEYHWLEGHYERLPALLADLVRRRVAVIATLDPNSALPAKAATTTIPIVFAVGEDPVALGLVASLAHPDGNATGINFFSIQGCCLSRCAAAKSVPRGSVMVGMRTCRSSGGRSAMRSSHSTPERPKDSVSAMMWA